jgi:mono/diheme cytochrome c family protein
MKSRLWVLLAAILGLGLAGAQSSSRSVWDGVYTDEQSKRGEALYGTACAKCHGDMLTGGEAAPPLVGGEFLANWNGLTVGDLFERIRISMPADRPGVLSGAQTADMLAHILRVNQFPSGKTELERQVEILKQIRFEATKPGDSK